MNFIRVLIASDPINTQKISCVAEIIWSVVTQSRPRISVQALTFPQNSCFYDLNEF